MKPREGPPAARDRLVAAAAQLLAQAQGEEVSTRAICELAGVQAPTLYHHFGSKQGLLDAVVSHGFEQYLTAKRDHPASGDPVRDIRAGWDDHVRFGVDNPSLYALMYGRTRPGQRPAAADDAESMLLALFTKAQDAGRLRTTPARATSELLAANVGVTLALITTPEARRDPRVAEALRDAVLASLTADDSPRTPSRQGIVATQPVERSAAQLVDALDAGAASADRLDPREQVMLRWWLQRLAVTPQDDEPPG